jgi:CheY-like chemotaxis protein
VVDKRANILLVDDKPQNLVVLESILDAPEYRLIRAHNANQALEALLAEDIAAIVLDVEMR